MELKLQKSNTSVRIGTTNAILGFFPLFTILWHSKHF